MTVEINNESGAEVDEQRLVALALAEAPHKPIRRMQGS